MRKDPLDIIDGGTKVRLALRRLLNPQAAKVRSPGGGRGDLSWAAAEPGTSRRELRRADLPPALAAHRALPPLLWLQADEEAKKKKEEEAKAEAEKNKKAGSWGGLPGGRK